MAKVAVIGAGVMGLAAAYQAAKLGHEVEIFEASGEPGGMAAHFDFDGLSIERFYHFVCRSDHATFDLLKDLGLGDAVRWQDTSMGLFFGGRLHPWGDPLALLKFPGLSWLSKFRYGMQMFLATRRQNWRPLDGRSARDWLIRGGGLQAYETLWEPLLRLKFHQYSDDLSAAWLWCRIKRLGQSRRSVFQETLGYIEGGSQTLVDALVENLEQMGARIRLGDGARELRAQDGKVHEVVSEKGSSACDAVISTVPTPLIPELMPALPQESKAGYEQILNIGVVCVALKLSRSVSPHFWVNISDPGFDFPGFVEFSRLRPIRETVVYVPFYVPQSHPRFQKTDAETVADCMAALRRINPELGPDDLLASRVGRLKYAQPVCTVGFANRLPAIQTPIAGLQVADTCFYYPEDRGISESVNLGREMAERLGHA